MSTTAADWNQVDDLGRVAARGGLVTAAGSWARFALQLGTLIVIARILGPEQYGVAAVLLVVVLAAELIRAGGVLGLVNRTPELSGGAATTLHLLSIAAGLLAAGLLTGVGAVFPTVDADLGGPALPMLGVVFVAAGVGAVPTALLSRNLRFRSIAVAEVGATVVSNAVALTFAFAGAGAIALVWQSVVYAVVLCVAILLACPWRASRPISLVSMRGELAFAANVTAVQAIEWCGRSIDRLLVSFFFGPTAAGLWAQAAQLLTLPLEQVNGPLRRVAVPILARLAQEDHRFVRCYRSLVTITCAVLWPAFAVLWVLADQVVLVLFGPAWIDSADVFRALIGSAAAQTVGYVTVWVFIATGQGRLQTMWACTTLPLSVVGSCVGAQWGVIGVGIAASVSVALLVLPGFLIAARRTPLHLRDLLSCLPGPAALAALCAAAAGAVLSVPTGASSVAVIMTCCSAAILVWAVVVVTVPRARRRSLAVVRRVVVRAA